MIFAEEDDANRERIGQGPGRSYCRQYSIGRQGEESPGGKPNLHNLLE
jgi:hypothetical protein